MGRFAHKGTTCNRPPALCCGDTNSPLLGKSISTCLVASSFPLFPLSQHCVLGVKKSSQVQSFHTCWRSLSGGGPIGPGSLAPPPFSRLDPALKMIFFSMAMASGPQRCSPWTKFGALGDQILLFSLAPGGPPGPRARGDRHVASLARPTLTVGQTGKKTTSCQKTHFVDFFHKDLKAGSGLTRSKTNLISIFMRTRKLNT